MEEITIVKGGTSIDERGKITHVNDFDMSDVERFYVIHQDDTSVIRAWHGHQFEKKYFYALKGSFTMAFVKVDDWENPSADLKPEIYTLSNDKSEVLCIPQGYANGLKANEPNSMLLVYSNKVLAEAINDSWRYDKNMWVDWSKY